MVFKGFVLFFIVFCLFCLFLAPSPCSRATFIALPPMEYRIHVYFIPRRPYGLRGGGVGGGAGIITFVVDCKQIGVQYKESRSLY